MPTSDPAKHPVVGLKKLIGDQSLEADLLLCAGDLGHAASQSGVRYGWEQVHEIATALKQASVIATAGNHDLTSRPDVTPLAHDPEETLKELVPLFPYDDRQLQQAFFSDHYALIEGNGYRVVTLNSSAHHGRGNREFDHGRVTPATRSKLLRDLQTSSRKPINILLCHHHLIEYTGLDEPDRSTIVGGPLLLKTLEEAEIGPWLVIHGHKHLPRLGYAPGSNAAPAIFSAGSLASALFIEQASHTRNQFYLLEIDPVAAESQALGLVARFRSWYWVSNRGWEPTPGKSGLPAQGGLGLRGDPRRIATDIRLSLDLDGRLSAAWPDLCALLPALEFLAPLDLAAVAAELRLIGCSVKIDSDGRYEEVSVPWP